MHSQMCVYLLQTFVLVGLDWAHAFSCIRTLHSLYSNILNCFGTFLIVSFSLSRSFLCQSASMAPKCKSTLSWNPFHSEVSSSSEPTPSHVWFHDDKAKLDFFENFSRCGIHSEHQVILLDFSNTNLPTVIYSRGWESLCGAPVTCPSVIIQELYSNMHGFDYSIPQFSTRV